MSQRHGNHQRGDGGGGLWLCASVARAHHASQPDSTTARELHPQDSQVTTILSYPVRGSVVMLCVRCMIIINNNACWLSVGYKDLI